MINIELVPLGIAFLKAVAVVGGACLGFCLWFLGWELLDSPGPNSGFQK